MKYIVNVSVTASATEVSKQFKGILIFKNEQKKEIKFDYLCIDHKNSMHEHIDIKFSNEKENFHIKGVPSDELINKFNEKEQLVVFLSSLLLRDAIYRVKDFLRMSYANIPQMKKMYKKDSPIKVSESFSLTEIGYKLIFES